MKLLRVIHNIYGTAIVTPAWCDDTLGLDWVDDPNNPPVRIESSMLYWNSPDKKSHLLELGADEAAFVKPEHSTKGFVGGLYRCDDGETVVPVLLGNWGIMRIWVEDNLITRIPYRSAEDLPPIRLSGRVLNKAQGTDYLLGAATAAEQLGTPYSAKIIEYIEDGEYVIASRNDGSKTWLEVA